MFLIDPIKSLKRMLLCRKEAEKMIERGRIIGTFQVSKFENDEALLDNSPYLIGKPFKNLMLTAGLQLMLNLLTGQGGTSFSNANAYIGIGDSTTVASVGQTDLQASTNKLRVAMDVTFPSAASGGVVTWRSTFTSGQANYHWQEFGIFNAAAAGTMLDRAVSDQGTKTSGQSWQPTVTLTAS